MSRKGQVLLAAGAPTRWILNPLVDLSCISAGWVVFFLVPAFSAEHAEATRTVAFTFFIAHRYFTFPLVYLDRAEFRRRRWTYLVVPVLCLGGVGACYAFRVDEPEMFTFWWFFNYFHFVRQKFGILRIYSGRGGWGSRSLDELVTYGWGAAGMLYMLATQADVEGRLMHYLVSHPVWLYAIVTGVAAWWVVDELSATGGRRPATVVAMGLGFVTAGVGASALATATNAGPDLALWVYAVFGAVTLVWLVRELRAPGGASWPKVLFVLSVIVMYGVGPTVSATAVLVATSFSHASEYIALAALAARNKGRASAAEAPALASASRHIVASTVAYLVAVSLVLQGMKAWWMFGFLVFTYGTSFAHFVFDGMIWKLRRPKVAQEVGA